MSPVSLPVFAFYTYLQTHITAPLLLAVLRCARLTDTYSMNTLTRLDSALAAAIYGLQSSNVPLPTPPSSPLLSSGPHSTRLSNLPPSPRKRRAAAARRRRPNPPHRASSSHRRRRRSFLPHCLALWSILLAFWRSLVGEIRAERTKRTNYRRRANTLEVQHERTPSWLQLDRRRNVRTRR